MDDKIKTFIIVTFCIDEYVHTCKMHWAIEKFIHCGDIQCRIITCKMENISLLLIS